ncbi:hypothetical protein BJ165DRAFT_1577107 [Panaeolus papilionaceus]|nr:hypothetical protein BJ165DRAFT_1577107 [Panaeolus papilionaceus]
MSHRRPTSSVGHSNKRRIEASPVEAAPPSLHIRVPPKKKKHNYEDDITFTSDEDLTPSVLRPAPRMGSRMAYMSEEVPSRAATSRPNNKSNAVHHAEGDIDEFSEEGRYRPAVSDGRSGRRNSIASLYDERLQDTHRQSRNQEPARRPREYRRESHIGSDDQMHRTSDRHGADVIGENREGSPGPQQANSLAAMIKQGGFQQMDRLRDRRDVTPSPHSRHLYETDGSDGRDHRSSRAPMSFAPASALRHVESSFLQRGYESPLSKDRCYRSPSPSRHRSSRPPSGRDHRSDHSQLPSNVAFSSKGSNRGRSPTVHQLAGESRARRSPSWGPILEEQPALFSMDEDRVESPNVEIKAPIASTEHEQAGDDRQEAAEDGRSFKLDDYVEEDLPNLAFCEMRPSFVPLHSNHVDPCFLDLSLIAGDLQDEDLCIIESAHRFEHSIPYANIALCSTNAFHLQQHTNRLIWANDYVLQHSPSYSSNRPRNVVGIMVGMVRHSSLKKAVNLSTTGKKTYLLRRLRILPCEMPLKRMARMMATKLQRPAVKVALDGGCIINFSVKGSNGAASPVANRYARPPKSTSTESSTREGASISEGFYPAVLEFDEEVKVYNAMGTGFRFNKEHLDKLHELPEYSTFSEDGEVGRQCLVAVGYTLNAYTIPPVDKQSAPGAPKECPTLSTNIQFAVVLAILPFAD